MYILYIYIYIYISPKQMPKGELSSPFLSFLGVDYSSFGSSINRSALEDVAADAALAGGDAWAVWPIGREDTRGNDLHRIWVVWHWLVVSTPLKNISQLGWLFPIYRKIKNVPNHQPGHDWYILIWTRKWPNSSKFSVLMMWIYPLVN